MAQSEELLDQFLDALSFKSGLIELRALPGAKRLFATGSRDPNVGRFLNAHQHRNLFFGVAARRDASSGALRNCASLMALFVDLDFKTQGEDTTRHRLGSFSSPPSIVVASGGGLHAYWLLREPIDLQRNADHARMLLRRIAISLGGDLAAAEPARVLRLPRTLNHKYDPARAVVLEQFHPDLRYGLEPFESLPVREPVHRHRKPATLPSRVQKGRRNSTLYRLGRSLKARGRGPEEIKTVLSSENTQRCDPPLPEGELAELAEHVATQPDRPQYRSEPLEAEPFDHPDHHEHGGSPWANATPAPDFLNTIEPESAWLYHRLLAPGAVTHIYSPRGIGKTLTTSAVAVAVARQGKRVMLLDRDNPPQQVRARLRGWGAAQTPTLKVMTRGEVPPLTDTRAWRSFPWRECDLVIIDSLDSSTEGVGEKDSAKPSRALAPILDIARQSGGPAFLIPGNTIKSGTHARGSGVIEDRADIVYEVRDATNFTPTGTKEWWLELPPAGADSWGDRARRRQQRVKYRLAFVPSKFRVAEEPAPFVLEIDLGSEPWSLRDVTAELVRDGEQAATAAQAGHRQIFNVAVEALKQEIRARASGGLLPMLADKEAVPFLTSRGLKRSDAYAILRTGEDTNWRTVVQLHMRGKPKWLLPPLESEEEASGGIQDVLTHGFARLEEAAIPPARINDGRGKSVASNSTGALSESSAAEFPPAVEPDLSWLPAPEELG